MNQYRVRLASQTDDQWREMTVAADTEKLARAICVRRERKLTDFSLIPAEPVAPVEPDSDDAEVLVQYLNAREAYARDAEEYPARREAAEDALTQLRSDHSVDKAGNVSGPTRRGKAHLHAHLQQAPYKIVAVEPIVPNPDQLVRAILDLQHHDGAWKKVLGRLRDEGIPLDAVTASLFGLQAQKNIDGSAPVVWSSATIKVALTTNTWTPNQDTHDFFDDVTNEVTGPGYTAGGATLASKTSTYDTASDQIRLDAADTSWTSSTITARRAAVYNDTAGAASTDPVLGWVDFGADVATTAGTFQITWDATGIIVYDVT